MPKVELRSNAKPSIYAPPPPLEEKKREEKERVTAAVLSITARAKRREAAHSKTVAASAAAGAEKMEVDEAEEKKKEEKKEEKPKEEPNFEILQNPAASCGNRCVSNEQLRRLVIFPRAIESVSLSTVSTRTDDGTSGRLLNGGV